MGKHQRIGIVAVESFVDIGEGSGGEQAIATRPLASPATISIQVRILCARGALIHIAITRSCCRCHHTPPPHSGSAMDRHRHSLHPETQPSPSASMRTHAGDNVASHPAARTQASQAGPCSRHCAMQFWVMQTKRSATH